MFTAQESWGRRTAVKKIRRKQGGMAGVKWKKAGWSEGATGSSVQGV